MLYSIALQKMLYSFAGDNGSDNALRHGSTLRMSYRCLKGLSQVQKGMNYLGAVSVSCVYEEVTHTPHQHKSTASMGYRDHILLEEE